MCRQSIAGPVGLSRLVTFLAAGILGACVWAGGEKGEPGEKKDAAETGGPAAAEKKAGEGTEKAPGAKEGWTPLFDGKTLKGWKIADTFDFAGHGPVRVSEGAILLDTGGPMTGIVWTGKKLPREEYEISLEAKRREGGDFFCGLTFPVGEEPCTLIIGGWGGSVVGLSNVDDMAAADNETTTGMSFEDDRWYRIRLRVTKEKIRVWIDDKEVIGLDRAGHRFSIWWEQEPMKPLGVANWWTGSSLRNVRLRRLGEAGEGGSGPAAGGARDETPPAPAGGARDETPPAPAGGAESRPKESGRGS